MCWQRRIRVEVKCWIMIRNRVETKCGSETWLDHRQCKNSLRMSAHDQEVDQRHAALHGGV